MERKGRHEIEEQKTETQFCQCICALLNMNRIFIKGIVLRFIP